MNKLTYAEISEILNSKTFETHDHDPSNWMYGDVYESVDDIENDDDDFKKLFLKLGKFEMVARHGGEGKGDQYWSVYHFDNHDVYIKFGGWYASHHGAEYNGMEEVFPELETRTVYKAKK